MPSPSAFSLIRTRMKRFLCFNLVFSDQVELLGRKHYIFQRRMFSSGVHSAKMRFEEAPASTAGIAGIPQCPSTPLRRCLITPGPISYFWNTHIL